MAGNTKLMGFGSDNKVTLKRWGKEATAVLSEDSWERLLYICKRMLPTEPKKIPRNDNLFHVRYDESTGRIGVVMGLDSARELYKLLSSERAEVEMIPWAQDIDGAIRAHHDYHNLDEPGVG